MGQRARMINIILALLDLDWDDILGQELDLLDIYAGMDNGEE